MHIPIVLVTTLLTAALAWSPDAYACGPSEPIAIWHTSPLEGNAMHPDAAIVLLLTGMGSIEATQFELRSPEGVVAAGVEVFTEFEAGQSTRPWMVVVRPEQSLEPGTYTMVTRLDERDPAGVVVPAEQQFDLAVSTTATLNQAIEPETMSWYRNERVTDDVDCGLPPATKWTHEVVIRPKTLASTTHWTEFYLVEAEDADGNVETFGAHFPISMADETFLLHPVVPDDTECLSVRSVSRSGLVSAPARSCAPEPGLVGPDEEIADSEGSEVGCATAGEASPIHWLALFALATLLVRRRPPR